MNEDLMTHDGDAENQALALLDRGNAPQLVSAGAVEAMTRGEIDIQIATAKKYPRSLREYKQRATLMVQSSKDIAQSCQYALKRSGKTITGPSIRLAEIVASCWGNLRCQAMIISEGDGHIVARAMVHDLETNVAYGTDVRRNILRSNGQRYTEDMITVTAQAAMSIAMRNAIFKAIPRAYVKPIEDAAVQKMLSDAKQGVTPEQRWKKTVAYWAKSDVTEAQILAAADVKSWGELTDEHYATLLGFVNAIRDGECSIEDVFGRPGAPSELQPGSGSFGFKRQKEAPKDDAAAVLERIQKCASYDDLKKLMVAASEHPTAEVVAAYDAKARELTPK